MSENDEAILSLKAWHKPLDPHHYRSALQGALAFPMLARGRLLGVLSLGERAGGEAYAPDDVEALSQLAHGVGSALGALSAEGQTGAGIDATRSIATAVRALGEKIDALAQSVEGLSTIQP